MLATQQARLAPAPRPSCGAGFKLADKVYRYGFGIQLEGSEEFGLQKLHLLIDLLLG
jgi:hypothetical protein